LREVLRRDFLDFVRSKRATTSVYPDDERADGQDLSESTIDQRVGSYGNPEDEHLQSERLVWHGVDIRTLQSWMGHRDIKSTMVYLKGVQSKDALAKVNAGALARYVA
jgi:integrase